MSGSLRPHGLKHARLLCPSLSPGVYWNSCPSCWWCHLSSHLILCHPILLLPSIFPSIKVFSSELALHIRWRTYWSFSFSNSFSNEYAGLISFRIDWFDLLAVQGTLRSLLQNHNSKASVLDTMLQTPCRQFPKTLTLTHHWSFQGIIIPTVLVGRPRFRELNYWPKMVTHTKRVVLEDNTSWKSIACQVQWKHSVDSSFLNSGNNFMG